MGGLYFRSRGADSEHLPRQSIRPIGAFHKRPSSSIHLPRHDWVTQSTRTLSVPSSWDRKSMLYAADAIADYLGFPIYAGSRLSSWPSRLLGLPHPLHAEPCLPLDPLLSVNGTSFTTNGPSCISSSSPDEWQATCSKIQSHEPRIILYHHKDDEPISESRSCITKHNRNTARGLQPPYTTDVCRRSTIEMWFAYARVLSWTIMIH